MFVIGAFLDYCDRLPGFARDPQTVVGYDNYNFADRVRDQALGVPYSTMRSLTTSVYAKSPHLPPTGLHQGMHDRSKPLDYDDFVETPSMRRRDLVSVQCTKFGQSTRARSIVYSGGRKSLFLRCQW
jgi:hypothetical protein